MIKPSPTRSTPSVAPPDAGASSALPAAPRASTIRIEPMAESHLEAVLGIEEASAPQPWSMGIFLDELAASGERVYAVALDGGSVIGFCGVLLVPAAGAIGEAHVTNVATDPAHRGRGVARALLSHTLAAAKQRGAGAATLEVRVSNAPARGLYQSMGFAPVGVRPRYYQDNDEDALILWKHEL